MDFLTIDDFNFDGKTVLFRVDINSPIKDGEIADDTRIRRSIETINALSNAKIVLLAHQSRPGKRDFTTMEEHAKVMSNILGRNVKYVNDLFGEKAVNAIRNMGKDEIIMLENVRFYDDELLKKPVEELAKTDFVKNLSPLADYYINDAFAAAHRSQTSLVAFSETLPSIAGRTMEREIKMLGRALNPEHPNIAVLGGAKIDDSIDVMENMLEKGIADRVLTTGVVANMFLIANSIDVGKTNTDFIKKSLKEYDRILNLSKELLQKYENKIEIPDDVALNDDGERKEIPVSSLPSEKPIFDIGKKTINRYIELIKNAKTVILNGPAGVFEEQNFELGTKEIFKAVSSENLFSVTGGGDTVRAMNKYNLKAKHMSTGGGACINFLAGRKMPGIEALKKSKRDIKQDTIRSS
ncbi:MAG: phosphoglycerate kinase [Candidatus Thermoplasmatota archaeon]|nr:phosphoglycerate kinase [Candidatus Thermoplasmatota archaeon]